MAPYSCQVLTNRVQLVSPTKRRCDWRQLSNPANDAIIGKDLDNRITSWNQGAEYIFGYSSEEMVSHPIRALIPANRLDEETQIMRKTVDGERVHFETQRLAKDGRLLDVAVTASQILDVNGKVVGISEIARDITLVKQRERELERFSRLCTALSRVSRAIFRTSNREELFRNVCQTLVIEGGFRMAWVGWQDPASGQLVPVAQCSGDENGYLQGIMLHLDRQDPSASAFHSGQPFVSGGERCPTNQRHLPGERSLRCLVSAPALLSLFN